MPQLEENPPKLRARTVDVDARYLTVFLEDERIIKVPLWWYPKLHDATPLQRTRWRLIAGGFGISWEEIDEDLSVQGLLRETSTPVPRKRSRR